MFQTAAQQHLKSFFEVVFTVPNTACGLLNPAQSGINRTFFILNSSFLIISCTPPPPWKSAFYKALCSIYNFSKTFNFCKTDLFLYFKKILS
jgi:hypothetical protein